MEKVRVNIIPFLEPIPVCHISQNDVGRSIDFELYEGLTPYSLSNSATAILHLEFPDGSFITKSLVNNSSFVTLTVDDDISEIAGRSYAKINIEKGEQDIGTSLIYIDVEKAP